MNRPISASIFACLLGGLLPFTSLSNETFNCNHAQLYAAGAMAMRTNGLDYTSALNQLIKDPSLNPNPENSLYAQEAVRFVIANALDEAYATPSFLIKNLNTLEEKKKFVLAFAEDQKNACDQELKGLRDVRQTNPKVRCSKHKNIARFYMAARQEPIPIDQISPALSDDELHKFHIETVYKRPLEPTVDKKASAIDVYGNEVYIQCINVNGAAESKQ